MIWLLLASSGIVILTILNSRWFDRQSEESPTIFRPPVDPLARSFVYFFALAPALGFQRQAQWRLDFIAAENSMGFHAPQEAARVLGEAIDYARQGQISAMSAGQGTAAKPSATRVSTSCT